MPTEALPFSDGQASGLDALSGAPQLMVNSLVDLGGSRRARPGVSAWADFPTAIPNASPVDAMAVWDGKLIYATRDRQLFAWTAPDTVSDLSDGTAASMLDGALRPSILSTRTRAVIVGGGVPSKWEGGTLAELLGGSPPLLNSIAGIASRLVGGVADVSGTFAWSNLGDTGHEVWDGLNFAEAEAKTDVLRAVADNTNELFAFGTETLQVFSPDAILGFAPGRTINVGTLSPYSIVAVDDMFAFLDRERRFVITDGRSFSDEQSVLSKPIEAPLRALTVEDCWGFRMRTDRWDAVVWMFPTDGKGFIWNRRSNTWSEWRAFGDTGYTAPSITSAVAWPDENLFLVGLDTGQIAKLDAAAYTDLGDVIKVELMTGFLDHGTDNLKHCKAVRFAFRRGTTAQSGTAPVVQISYRDDTGPFCPPATFSLGLAGDYDPILDMRSEGTYRRRQWRLEYTSAAELSFLGAREEFVLLDN